jgi:signal recognition particle subunit SRP54
VPFAQLTDKLSQALRQLRGRGKLTERDVDEALRQVRLVLLEADVNFRVAKDFVARVRDKAVGEEVLSSITPAQKVVKIVKDELAALMGEARSGLAFSQRPPTVVMLVGLHGAGKTTAAAKLGYYLRAQGHHPVLIAADLRRPAAQDQLVLVGRRHGLAVWTGPTSPRPDPEAPEMVGVTLEVIATGVAEARRLGHDVAIVDTGGRLHVDRELMAELSAAKKTASATEILLVVDAMTGQDAVNVAETFAREVGIDGVILTKLDGDARGGAALSVRAVTGKPIKFVGVGEKIGDFEPFYPERMASRILDMGDVVSLVERAEASMDAAKALDLQQKMRRAEFTLEDFLGQIRQVRKMGSLEDLLGLLPGLGKAKKLQGLKVDDGEFGRLEAIISSMTKQERHNPSIIDGGRRRRIAAGSGTTTSDVNRLLQQYSETRKLVRRMASSGRDGLGGLGRLPRL